MATFNRIDTFTRDVFAGDIHHFKTSGGDQYAVYLSPTAPSDASNVSDLGTTSGASNIADYLLTLTAVDIVTADLSVAFEDKVMAATGAVGPFRYVYVYNTVNGALVGFYDFLSDQNLINGQNFIVDFTDANNYLFTVTSP